jgi:hypothetical protein
MESVGVGRLRLQAGDGQRLETLFSVLRGIDQFERRHFHIHRGAPCLARSRACGASSGACGYRCATRGSPHRRASSLKRGAAEICRSETLRGQTQGICSSRHRNMPYDRLGCSETGRQPQRICSLRHRSVHRLGCSETGRQTQRLCSSRHRCEMPRHFDC